MVAVIKTGNSIRRTFLYNENKLKAGVAECIQAQNYPLDLETMTENQRLQMLLKTAEKNPDVTRNSVHISLNFSPGELLSTERMKAIAGEYMERIGFGGQPYLVYQHHDAGHPHLHLVTVKIRPDGSKIDMQNIGRNQSETARKVLELKYGLVRAEEQKKQVFQVHPVNAEKVQYGKTETKRAITNVLDTVLKPYKYTSLPELNAALNLYNINAERGAESSRIFKNKGLVYRVLDREGKPVGVPIKASLIYNKPTLAYLEKQFLRNETLRKQHKTRVKTSIDFALKGRNPSLEKLTRDLKKAGIHTVLRENKSGLIYGITFVDHRTKCVFNGSALGKDYSAKAIGERCRKAVENQVEQDRQAIKREYKYTPEGIVRVHTYPHDIGKAGPEKALAEQAFRAGLSALLGPDQTVTTVPYELKGKQKRKRKRRRRKAE